MKSFFRYTILTSLLTLGLTATLARERPTNEEAVAEENLTAVQILNACTRMIPQEPTLLKGTLTVRKLRGIVLLQHSYNLLMDWGATIPNAEVLLLDKRGTAVVERVVMTRPVGMPAQLQRYEGAEQHPTEAPSYAARIRGTDMTWMDLTLDFLWWPDARFDDTPRGESRNGRDCDIIVAVPPWPIPGCSAVRIWVDRQLRCLMQVEQLDPQGNPARKMWVQRVKKMDNRWMIRDMEVETINSGHRTRLSVEDASTP